jgi:hypothetical protein
MNQDTYARTQTALDLHTGTTLHGDPRTAPTRNEPVRTKARAFVGASPLRLQAHVLGSPRRSEIERFIAAEFARHFDACVRQFMPTLLGLHDADDTLYGAVGCRNASFEPLFLETYTQTPIENLIAAKLRVVVPRTQIVEIGSLACRDGRVAVAIVQHLVPYLIDAGFTWVVFTGADTVRNVFRRLKLEPHELCLADKTLLGDSQYDWGTYYELDSMPRVQ